MYFEPWVVLVGGLLAAYGFERALVDIVRYIDRRMGHKPKGPTGFIPPKG